MNNPKKVIMRAPLLTQSGYGEQSRFALRSLRSRPDLFEIYILPIQWGATSWSREYDEERLWIDQRIEATVGYMQQGGKFDMSLQVTIPNEFEKMAPINVGYTAGIETSKMAPEWIEKINLMDRVMTISSHSQRVMQNTEYEAVNNATGEEFVYKADTGRIKYINYPAKTHEELPDIDLELPTKFNFLCASQFGLRKNIENTIKWFIEEFREDEDVGLVVKTNLAKNCYMDRIATQTKIKELISSCGDKKCRIYLLHGDMTDKEMHSLYKHEKINAFVSLAHGEGFGLTIFEAAYSGLPVIATGWSGQLDFLVDEKGKDKFYNVSFDLSQVQEAAVWKGVVTADSMWAFPRDYSAKKRMREVYENYDNKIVVDGINERFAAEKMYAKFVEIFNGPTQNVDEWLEELSNELVVNE